MSGQWKMHRAGIFGYWNYDYQEYFFEDGKMMLRGKNGSGKSVTMQALVTVVLDGNTTPGRLDAGGGTSRTIRDYLIGDEADPRPERTAYLFIEFKRDGEERYITCGIGLYAKATSTKRGFLGYVLKDNSRIGRDLHLFQTSFDALTGQKVLIPASLSEFEGQVTNAQGTAFDSAGAYSDAVNKALFGFGNVASFHNLMDILAAIRSPKLGAKGVRPDVINQILREAQPSVGDAELGVVAESIRNMDRIQAEIETNSSAAEAFRNLAEQYAKYEEFVLANRALLVKRTAEASQEARAACQAAEENMSRLAAVKGAVTGRLQRLANEKATLRDEQSLHQSSEAGKLERDKAALEEDIAREEAAYGRIAIQQQEAKRQLSDKRRRRDDADREHEQAVKALDEGAAELAEWASACAFADHGAYMADPAEWNDAYFRQWKGAAAALKANFADLAKLIQQLVVLEEEKERARSQVNDIRTERVKNAAERDKAVDRLDQARTALVNDISSWLNAHSAVMAVSPDDIRRINQAILRLYAPLENNRFHNELSYEPYHASLQIVERNRQEAMNILMNEANRAKLQHTALTAEYEETVGAIEQLRSEALPEPPVLPEIAAERRKLNELDIPCVRFFEAVDFLPGVRDEEKAIIESAIRDMGILDSLVVPESYWEQMPRTSAGHILVPQGTAANNLSRYLTPVTDSLWLTPMVEKILQSIAVDTTRLSSGQNGAAALSVEDASYRQGMTVGLKAVVAESRFIGLESRTRYRAQQLADLVAKADKLAIQLRELTENLADCEEQNNRLMALMSSYPGVDRVRSEADIIMSLDKEDGRLAEQLAAADAKYQNVIAREKEQAQRTETGLVGCCLEKKTAMRWVDVGAQLDQRLTAVDDYRDALADFSASWQNKQASATRMADLEQDMRILEKSGDDLRDEATETGLTLERLRSRLKAIRDKLVDPDTQAVLVRLSYITVRTGAIDRMTIGWTRRESVLDQRRRGIVEQVPYLKSKALMADELALAAVRLFDKEYGRHHPQAGGGREAWSKYVPAKSREIRLGELASRLKRQESDLFDTITGLQDRLTSYNLTREMADDAVSLPVDDDIIELNTLMSEARVLFDRVVVYGHFTGGQVITPAEGQRYTLRQVEILSQNLTEENRQLFEEIMLANVGDTIVEKIRQTQAWVAKMNETIAVCTCGDASFKISWDPVPPVSPSEVSVMELFDLLQQGSDLISDENKVRIGMHFKQKFSQAKAIADENNQDYIQVVTAVLDYRQWFKFTPHYRKAEWGSGSYRPLTTIAYGKLSGGQRAMALYLPLFAAANARMSDAHTDAPRLVTLDEAFAGVDTKSIEDLFRLLEELRFDYILNSQILWCTYPSVKRLAIYELLGENKMVTVIRYIWNGKVKQLVDSKIHNKTDGLAG